MMGYQTATVRNCEFIGEQVRYLSVVLESPMTYSAGQFFLLRLKGPDGEFVERSYSAANFGDGRTIEFVIRIEPNGKMSSLIENLKEGSSFDLKGPFGKFGFSALKEPPKKVVLIAGGVGISPLRSMIHDRLQKPQIFPIQLFYGVRSPKDFLFQEELREYITSGRISMIPAISDDSSKEPWTGKKGFISDCLEPEIFPPMEGTHIFLCGPPLMVKAVRMKLSLLGYHGSSVHLEAW